MAAARKPAPDQPRWTEYVDLDEITYYDGNPKNHDPGIGASIDRHGYVDPVIVDERTGKLVSGHGRLDMLKEKRAAGADAPDGITVDDGGTWKVPVNRGWSSKSDADAEAYLMGTNVLPGLGGWDDTLLADMMQRVAESPEGLEGTGFTDGDLSDLLDKLLDEGDEDSDEDKPASIGLGTPVIAYQIVFDDEDQQKRWYEFLRFLRDANPEAETIGQRIDEFVASVVESA